MVVSRAWRPWQWWSMRWYLISNVMWLMVLRRQGLEDCRYKTMNVWIDNGARVLLGLDYKFRVFMWTGFLFCMRRRDGWVSGGQIFGLVVLFGTRYGWGKVVVMMEMILMVASLITNPYCSKWWFVVVFGFTWWFMVKGGGEEWCKYDYLGRWWWR